MAIWLVRYHEILCLCILNCLNFDILYFIFGFLYQIFEM